ncbi:MAG: xanthine dehydrogenase family protein molybdopterin-binding subunit [Xanthobacteraceae bacterium]|jgi:aerobic carbon-monoxide dehydrogenase large subunit
MNLHQSPEQPAEKLSTGQLAVEKFAVGQSVPRIEDPMLLRGHGRYTDDVSLPGQAYAVMVRSRHGHGVLRAVNTEVARKMPGVLAVYTAADLDGYGPLKCNMPLKSRDGSPLKKPWRGALATDKVRYVGDPVACVIAETVFAAKDAAEAVEVDVDPLAAVIGLEDAARAGAPLLYDDVPGNVPLDYHFGNTAAVDTAFASAAHVTRLKLLNSRLVVNAMEPRAAVAAYDGSRFTVYVASQGVIGMRAQIADCLGVGPKAVHVITGQVGGSFGMKGVLFPEYVCILHGTRTLGRPVKWTDERSGSFFSDSHGRDQEFVGELALDKDGNFLAVRFTGFADMGAFLSPMGPIPGTLNIAKNVQSMYRTPLIEVSSKCVFTNTSQIGPYRGAGRPEGNYFMERLIDAAAAEMDIDRLALRRRNQIRRQDLPYRTASEVTYDSGDFTALTKQAFELADGKGFARRKRESARRGKLRGLGIGNFLEVTAPPSKELADIAFNADGTVTLTTGTLDFGMGHATPFAQVLSEKLGIPFDKISLVQGDSDRLEMGGGSGGSKSLMHSGTAIVEAAAKIIEKGKDIASHVLEAAVSDIEFTHGRFIIAGTDRSISVMELAKTLRERNAPLPADVPQSLDVHHISDGPGAATFPNGCHIAEVEVDPDTGVVELVKYTCVNDFGVVVNPLIVAGQLHGGVVQGIGQALMEMTVYDGDGQLLTGSFMDYAMPRATDVPDFVLAEHPVPAKTNPLGAKGCGEAGCAGSLTSVMNAVLDALADRGIRHLDMPLTPFRIWQALQQANGGGAGHSAR